MSHEQRERKPTLKTFKILNPLLLDCEKNRKNAVRAMKKRDQIGVQKAYQESSTEWQPLLTRLAGFCLLSDIVLLIGIYQKNPSEKAHQELIGLMTIEAFVMVQISIFQSLKYFSETTNGCLEWLNHGRTAHKPITRPELKNFSSYNPLLWETQTNREYAQQAIKNDKKSLIKRAAHQSRHSKEVAEACMNCCILIETLLLSAAPYLKSCSTYEQGEQTTTVEQVIISMIIGSMLLIGFFGVSMHQAVKHDSDTEKTCDQWLHYNTSPKPF